MNRWELIDSAGVPGTDSIMALMQRGKELVIRVDERELMGNRIHGSEDALAKLAFDRLDKNSRHSDKTQVLIGGLGIGFTLAAALLRLGPNGKVVVAELVPEVVRWNRGVLGETAGHPVLDPRTEIHSGDVAELIRKPPCAWDAILLDVDNGPNALSRSDNNWLYSPGGLDAAYDALRQGGILAVWSAAPDNAFTHRFERAGFDVEIVGVRARGAKGGWRHTIWLGSKRNDPPRWKKR